MNMDFHLATWLRLVTFADLSTSESLGVLKTNPVFVSVSKKEPFVEHYWILQFCYTKTSPKVKILCIS